MAFLPEVIGVLNFLTDSTPIPKNLTPVPNPVIWLTLYSGSKNAKLRLQLHPLLLITSGFCLLM